jgi:surfactin synthase thioesterase subunit
MTVRPLRPTLLSLPPAGVGPSLFRPWAGGASDAMRIHPVSLPGREARFNDPVPASLDALADRLAEELEPHIAGRYAIFGYSMGALLGYELGRRWVRWGLRAPEMFFALGCNAPDRMLENRLPFHTMNPQDFRQALVDLGGIHDEILNNPEAMALFEPVLRHDFRLCETYEHRPDRGKLACPAHVFVADDDDFISWAAASAWSGFVSGRVEMHSVEGGHMIARNRFNAMRGSIERLWLGAGEVAAVQEIQVSRNR